MDAGSRLTQLLATCQAQPSHLEAKTRPALIATIFNHMARGKEEYSRRLSDLS